jgi:hypothetical protein
MSRPLSGWGPVSRGTRASKKCGVSLQINLGTSAVFYALLAFSLARASIGPLAFLSMLRGKAGSKRVLELARLLC